MNSHFTANEIQFLTTCLERARPQAVLLDHTLSRRGLDLRAAQHCAVGVSGAVLDARRLMVNLGPQLRGGRQSALAGRLHDSHEIARVLHVQLTRTPFVPSDRVLRRTRRLLVLIDLALQLAREIATSVDETTEPVAGSWSSCRMAAWAVRVLPPAHRVRYREEFQAELYELRGRQQLRHGLRLLARAVALRRVLRATEPAMERRR